MNKKEYKKLELELQKNNWSNNLEKFVLNCWGNKKIFKKKKHITISEKGIYLDKKKIFTNVNMFKHKDYQTIEYEQRELLTPSKFVKIVQEFTDYNVSKIINEYFFGIYKWILMKDNYLIIFYLKRQYIKDKYI